MSDDANTYKMRKEMRLAQRRVHAALAQIDAFLASPMTSTGVVRDALLDVRLMLTSTHESRANDTKSNDNAHKDG